MLLDGAIDGRVPVAVAGAKLREMYCRDCPVTLGKPWSCRECTAVQRVLWLWNLLDAPGQERYWLVWARRQVGDS